MTSSFNCISVLQFINIPLAARKRNRLFFSSNCKDALSDHPSTAAIPYDDLLSETTGEFEGPFEAPLKRSLATYVSHADRFIPKQKQTLFQNQFNKLYGVRLKVIAFLLCSVLK